MGRVKIGEYFVKNNYVTQEEVNEALKHVAWLCKDGKISSRWWKKIDDKCKAGIA
jgi:hypothetical protein